MAKKLKLKKRRTLKEAAASGGDPGRKAKIKAHSRSPRGPDGGKSRVRVRRHSRKLPRG